MHPMVKSIEDPPKLTSGSGMPVTGIRPVTDAMLIAALVTIITVNPPASRRPYVSRVASASLTPA